MSLRVWLPLNKDLHNQGLENVTITNNGAVLNNYAYKGGPIILTGLNNLSFCNLSFSFWAKTSATTNWQLIVGIDNLELTQIHGIYFTDNSRIKLEYNPSVNMPNVPNIQIWHHYAFTITNGKSCGYIDGELREISTESVIDDIIGRIRLNNNSAISLSDFRIYDHALSKKEVKELSKGLYLHYTFANPYVENTVNLVPNGMTLGWGDRWQIVSSYPSGITPQGTVYKQIAADAYLGNGSTFLSDYNVPTNYNGKYITMSCWYYRKSSSSPQLDFYAYGYSTNAYQRITSQVSKTDTTKVGVWTYAVIVHQFFSDLSAYSYISYLRNQASMNDDFYMADVQIELKDHATPYTPTSRTQQYLKDVSGFDNHSLITGSLPLVTTPKSPRYDKCLNIDNSGTNKNYANCTIAAPQVESASFWVYIGSSFPSGSRIIFQNKPSHLAFGFHQGTGCITYAGTSAKPCRYVLTNIVKYNSWNHFVISQLEDFTTELWLNGIKQLNPTNTYWGENYDGFCFGARNNQSDISGVFTGKVSDFRLFSRVLTQADVDDLYKNSLSIDKSHNAYCYELNESDTLNGVNVKKNGQLICKNYSEDFDALYLPAGTYVDTLLNFAVGDTCKTETFIKCDTGGSGRDLMGFSGYAGGYWGVTTNSVWELHGNGTATNADITKYNRIDWNYTCETGDSGGTYKIGSLGYGSSVRNKTIYHIKLWKNSVLERDLYPCSVNNQVGLIDGLTGTFYPVQKLNSTAEDASLVSGTSKASFGKSGVTMNEIYEV